MDEAGRQAVPNSRRRRTVGEQRRISGKLNTLCTMVLTFRRLEMLTALILGDTREERGRAGLAKSALALSSSQLSGGLPFTFELSPLDFLLHFARKTFTTFRLVPHPPVPQLDLLCFDQPDVRAPSLPFDRPPSFLSTTALQQYSSLQQQFLTSPLLPALGRSRYRTTRRSGTFSRRRSRRQCVSSLFHLPFHPSPRRFVFT